MSQIWLPGKGKNEYICNADTVENITDGYHTFAELYEHRHLLFCVIANTFNTAAFKTKRNDKGEEWFGWFILGIETEYGQISYHLPMEYWSFVSDIEEIEYNENYDGHSSEDVLERLRMLLLAKDEQSYTQEEE